MNSYTLYNDEYTCWKLDFVPQKQPKGKQTKLSNYVTTLHLFLYLKKSNKHISYQFQKFTWKLKNGSQN